MGFHKTISFFKSAIRVLGYIAMVCGVESIAAFIFGLGLLIIAEALGVIEELKENN